MPTTYLRILAGDIEFSGNDFIDGHLVEEISPLSIILPAASLEFSLFSDNTDFSIINPSGIYADLFGQKPLAAYEVIDGSPIYLGQFFLQDWDNPSENVKHFTCTNIIGLLDKVIYRGGIWLTPTTAGAIVREVLSSVGLSAEIDPQIDEVPLTGWLPILSVRAALQQIAFASGAYILSTRHDGLFIGQLCQTILFQQGIRSGVGRTGQLRMDQLRWRTTQSLLWDRGLVVTSGERAGVAHAGQGRVWKQRFRLAAWERAGEVVDLPAALQVGRKVSLRTQVTAVEVTANDLKIGTGELNLLNQSLPAGQQEIRFQQPAHSLVANGANIIESGANYAILDVASPGLVTLTGLAYDHFATVYGVYLPEGTQKENVLKITDATLVGSANAAEICQRVFDYYQQRHVQEMKLLSPGERLHPGTQIILETLYQNRLVGVIEEMDTNLVGGNIAQTRVVGVLV
jgi:hypothetical protein